MSYQLTELGGNNFHSLSMCNRVLTSPYLAMQMVLATARTTQVVASRTLWRCR